MVFHCYLPGQIFCIIVNLHFITMGKPGQMKTVFADMKFFVLAFKIHSRKATEISSKTVKNVTTVVKTMLF